MFPHTPALITESVAVLFYSYNQKRGVRKIFVCRQAVVAVDFALKMPRSGNYHAELTPA